MMAKKKGNVSALQKFNKRVAAIKAAHPRMTHAAAQQQAKKEGKSNRKVSGTKKSSPKKVKKVATKKRVSSISSPRKVGSVAHTRAKLKKQLEEQLAWGLLARDSAKKVRDKKKKAEKVTEIKRELRAINGIGKRKRRR